LIFGGGNMSFNNQVVNQVLVDTGRCCAICHKFCGFKIELHHIKQKSDGGEDSYENCIPLCLDCHAEVKSYDPHHPKGRKYSDKELIMHRDHWYNKIKVSSQFHTEERFMQLDEEVFKHIRKQIYESGVITFLREHDFGISFRLEELNPLQNLRLEIEYNPEFEFIDADLEQVFANLANSIICFLGYSAINTFPHDVKCGYQYIPRDWLEKGEETAKHYYEVVNKMNELSTNIVDNYDIFAKLARKKFAV
jgi:hypothetical protein